jgi:AraC family transcriptional regulator
MLARYAPSTTIRRHDHELASVCIAMSGGYDEAYGANKRRVDPGTFVIHPEGEAHSDRHDACPTALLTIELSAVGLDLARRELRLFDKSSHRSATSLLPQAYRLWHEVGQAGDNAGLVVEAAIWEMLAEASDNRRLGAGRAPWLTEVRDYLEAHATDGPSMTLLSDMAGVHPVHLARSFRQRFGCSVGAYVRRRQVGAAVALLAQNDLPLADIALSAGFADQSHMTRLVKSHTGRAPGAWRTMLEEA